MDNAKQYKQANSKNMNFLQPRNPPMVVVLFHIFERISAKSDDVLKQYIF